MELIISRLNNLYEGMELSLKEDDRVRSLAVINGNRSEFTGPAILLDIDQHAVYGLSHPEVISRILRIGPQRLLTTRDLAHKLFEHGMKASLGRVKIMNNWFSTGIDSFYAVADKLQYMTLVVGERNKPAFLIQPRSDYAPILVAGFNFQFKEEDAAKFSNVKILVTDSIQGFVTARFEPNRHV